MESSAGNSFRLVLCDAVPEGTGGVDAVSRSEADAAEDRDLAWASLDRVSPGWYSVICHYILEPGGAWANIGGP